MGCGLFVYIWWGGQWHGGRGFWII